MKPYLNLGAGRVILPCPRPRHHSLVPEEVYAYPLWRNADRNAADGITDVLDLFAYPWPFADSAFDGALLAHIVEHIPHDIHVTDDTPRAKALAACQDGWYAFFAELYRVLAPGALVHILVPYGWSQGAITDPTHTRLVTEHTFTHSMQPDAHSPFRYETAGIHFEVAAPMTYHITEMFSHLKDKPELFTYALQTQINVVYEMYAQLRVVK